MANVAGTRHSKGDRVCIYLPMIPELAVSILACARIGAIHSVVLPDFQPAVASRIIDSECKMVITSDGGYRGNKTIALKEIIDEAEKVHINRKVLVKRTNTPITMKRQRYLVATLTRWSFRQVLPK
jgi:acetyl-CoA synthetase